MYLKKFLQLIPYGKRNALSMRELSVRSGNDLRTTRKMVEAARKEGYHSFQIVEKMAVVTISRLTFQRLYLVGSKCVHEFQAAFNL